MTDSTSMPVGDVLAASKGMLQKQLYAISTRPVAGLGPILENIEAHLAYQVKLEEDGVMFAAGPIWTDDEQHWEGEGLVIVRAASRQAAIAIAEADPMHKSGARSFSVRPWMINEGSVTITISYSGQHVEVN
ncbi:YciI family protein [Microbaculum marinum]|uniref:YciI family protein n=1 Tax=Microbaculum marinum TaxID=1764581 RepID=A0AAW9RSU0_9HYPH